MASFIAAGTAYATRGVPMVPFFIFYSMFGFQRVGDLIWQAADARARGFLLGATAGRTTLLGEGLQHQDGHSLVLASTVPPCQAYDPAFAYEVATIVQARHRSACTATAEPDADVFYYLTLYNENYPMPADARATSSRRGDRRGPVPLGRARPTGRRQPATILFSGSRPGRGPRGRRPSWPSTTTSAPSCGRPRRTSALREEALATERWNRLHPAEQPHGAARHRAARRRRRARSSPSPTS